MNDIDAEKIAHSKQVKLGLKSLDLSCNNITNIGTACFSRYDLPFGQLFCFSYHLRVNCLREEGIISN